jgi:hypothetical protein
MLLLSRLSTAGGYASDVLPSLLLLGVGIGCIFAPAFGTATLGVDGSEAGVASAMVNTSQQVGGSVGTALFSTFYASAVTAYTASHPARPGLTNAAAISGYTTAFTYAAATFALGLVLALVILPSRDTADVSAHRTAADRSTGVAATATPSATAILVTGPCSYFGTASHPQQARSR